MTELAARFKVHRNTVTLVARRAGLKLRNEMVPEERREAAVRLYGTGLSLDQAAERMGVGRETVRLAARAAGLSARPRSHVVESEATQDSA